MSVNWAKIRCVSWGNEVNIASWASKRGTSAIDKAGDAIRVASGQVMLIGLKKSRRSRQMNIWSIASATIEVRHRMMDCAVHARAKER